LISLFSIPSCPRSYLILSLQMQYHLVLPAIRQTFHFGSINSTYFFTSSSHSHITR
jgi:hypothetical protein